MDCLHRHTGLPLPSDKSVGRDGRILAIDKAVKAATSAQDMAAELGGLGAPVK